MTANRFCRVTHAPGPALVLSYAFLALTLSSPLRADDTIAARIDALIAAKIQGPVSPRADDGEFLRRVYLDLAGRIPTSDEARAFLADPAADKRAKVVDQLLASPDYARRMADAMHVMLMERQGDAPEWQKYLRESFGSNKPWDQMVREMIWSEPDNASAQGAAFFFTKRLENYGQNPVDYPGLVRDVGRLMLGMDIQCAQCHDHLFVKQYTQDYYQGIYAFLGQLYIRKDVKFPALGENPVKKKVEYTSVFVKEPKAIGPKLPGVDELMVPEFKQGEEFTTPPDRKTNFPGVLKFSPIRVLAEQLPRKENVAFSRNAVNRLWWLMMGRGIVHPLDLHHDENAPSHPELLELLAAEFTAHNFDIKWMLKQIASTEAYQRSSLVPEGVAPDSVPLDSYRTALEKPLSSEQLTSAVLTATGEMSKSGATPEELEKVRLRFAKSIANPPKEPETEYSPSVRAALFLSNDETILSWLQPRAGNLVDRLAAISDSDKLAEELYLATLTRAPSADEKAEVAEFLKRHADDRPKVLGRLVWPLLTTTEFTINH